ncbi:MAG: hypothetical protein U5K72_07165 [Balneolaceae bacterium]|nr:hypothetical protein [Balneolaceae bacterium]
MKKILTSLTIIFLATAVVANAQLREDLSYQPETYTTTLSSSQQTGGPGNWMNMLNMTMSHSYSMSFSNFGGQMQNMNAYTNHMFFDVSDRLKAQLDVSLLHSPFGNSFMTNNSNDFGAQIIIDQARLDYQLSDNASISFQFSQRPAHYGYGAFSPFNRMMRPWY